MFYLEVIQDDKVIQRREYISAGECTRNLLIALEYYVRGDIPVKIRMSDARGMLIKEVSRQDLDDLNKDITPLDGDSTKL